MKATEFVEVYPAELPATTMYAGPLAADMKQSREWSHYFGTLLHNRLTNPNTAPVNFDEATEEYRQWIKSSTTALFGAILDSSDPQKHSAVHELTFHSLNYAMLDCWLPLLFKDQSPKKALERPALLNGAQNCVALNAVPWYHRRQEQLSISEDYPYYAAQNFNQRKASEGILNESDLAIVALQIARKYKHLNIVPAPMQFEHGKQRRYNADFIAITTDDQVVGIQNKSNVSDETLAEYDPDHIMLVDSKVDFGNTSYRRITPGSSRYSRVGWGGILSVSRVATIKTVGKDAAFLQQFDLNPKFVNVHKQFARQMIGDPAINKANFERSVAITTNRLLPHLVADVSQTIAK